MSVKSANLYVRIEPEIKDEAEKILSVLGISPSNAINIFYKQIILQNGLPFDVKTPSSKPLAMAFFGKRSTKSRNRERISRHVGRAHRFS